MAGKTKIEWATDTWNPIAGCSIVSPGCTNCYAMRMAARLEKMLPAERRGEAILPHHYSALTQRDDGCYAYSGNAYIGCVIQTIDGYRWEILRLVGTGLATSMSEAKAAAAPKVEERP